MPFATRRMRRGSCGLLPLVLSVLPGLPAQEIPHTRTRLENGLTVVLHEDRRLPLVAVNLWYRVGSKDEPPGRSGFAHLFEHLMFMGTEKVPLGQFDLLMEAAGGSNNASTSTDRTNYFEVGPRELLELFLFLEADRMANLGRSIDQEKLDVQRGVVRNERRQSYENRPYGEADLAVPRLLYPPGHPYHHPVIGSHEDLERASVEDVAEFFKRFYFPGNASLVIAGDFDRAEALQIVEKHFGPLSSPPPPERPRAEAPRIDGTVRETLEDSVAIPRVEFMWHSPAAYGKGDAEMDILASILGEGKSSRLYRRLVFEKKLAQEVEAIQLSRALVSEFHIAVYARPRGSREEDLAALAEIEAEVGAAVAAIRDKEPEAREVERARNGILTEFWSRIERLAQRADLLNRYQFYLGDPGSIARDIARYESADSASVKEWARRVLLPDSKLIITVLPERKKSP